ncbi:hypothetical protein LJC64_02385 [Ruminococcaceae bacterium OttesenSCG-928-A11]|nr:hypothetical protein [Ruminococcaceae bacterium OttesenSCG-928-A11]
MKGLTKDQVSEMQRSYRNAEDKGKQVKILSELFAIPQNAVRSALGLEPVKDAVPAVQSKKEKGNLLDAAQAAVLAEKMTIKEAADHFGVKYASLWNRVSDRQKADDKKPARLRKPTVNADFEKLFDEPAAPAPKPKAAAPAEQAAPSPEPQTPPAAPAPDVKAIKDAVFDAQMDLAEAYQRLRQYIPSTSEETRTLQVYMTRIEGFLQGMDYMQKAEGVN